MISVGPGERQLYFEDTDPMADTPDDLEHSVRLRRSHRDYVPRRVASLVPSLTESLFDLDLGAVDRSDRLLHAPGKD
jgi:hypothetical protein